MKEVILIDFNNMLFRVHYTHRSLVTSKGKSSGVIHGVLQSLLSLYRKYPEASIVFCSDSTTKSWRREIFAGYKAQRHTTDNKDRELVHEQIPVIQNLLVLLGFRFLQFPNYEADDIIAVLAARMKKKMAVRILSNDKDFYQLIEKRVRVLRPNGSKIINMKASDVARDFGVHPNDWAKFKALCGDQSDNIKPIPGIGPKKALILFKDGVDASVPEYKYLEKIVRQRYPNLKEHWTNIHTAYKLINLRDHGSFAFEDSAFGDMCRKFLRDPERVRYSKKITDRISDEVVSILAEYELESIIARRNELWQIA